MEPSFMTTDSDHASSGICFVDPTSSPATVTADADVEALKRLSDNLGSIFQSQDFAFCADATITCDSRDLPVHRCVLSARSPFFRDFFSKHRDHTGAIDVHDLLGDFEVGFETLVLVMEYIYSGRVGELPKGVCMCVDESCSHAGCRPIVDFMVEVLFASFTFHIIELVNLFQRRLIDILERVAADDLPRILSVSNMCNSSCQRLLHRCIDIVAQSDLDMVALEKKLPPDIVKQIVEYRVSLGLMNPQADNFPNKHARRIHRALDSDDVELVRMLLKEGHTTLDDAYALHYAVEHCDSKITMELLDLELADVNHRNLRSYTVLHVAAMRKDPKIIVSLLTKGARPSDLTQDGRKAVQIAKRMTKSADYYRILEEGKASPKDMLCVEILEQAERRDPLVGEASVSLALAGDDMRGKLLYLENRVALARIMFPMEARVAMDIAQVDGTLEFTLGSNSNSTNGNNRSNAMDLNDTPFQMKEEHRARMKALARTVELGKKFFPRCSDVLDKIMDDELTDLADLTDMAGLNRDTSEEKRRHYEDLQNVLQRAFSEDRQELDLSALSSSSSSTSIHRARR
ncbi:BTB/POZ domain and ankyrin repeat-containing protein NPR1 [Rhynchospora pubera]|uniref:BTB/POZ domain and ankyrin repeat-containing protein NPR1 n=1 Tax=Rhynchospora pubera TaxID=906938 RepID=A0AAV8HSH8_9POAL|nr:BTB/POZ domain and ankyrin repeat-containing protein NPR1 [Rhynchospora pubera]